MPSGRFKTLLDRDAREDLSRRTLSQIPTLYGKLLYLASLRDSNTGRYAHHGLALLFGERESDRALRQHHKRVFAEWVEADLAAKESDLRSYLESLPEPMESVLHVWEWLLPWMLAVPGGSSAAQRALYAADMRTVLTLLRARGADSPADPAASPPR